jgi:hypothetical protein
MTACEMRTLAAKKKEADETQADRAAGEDVLPVPVPVPVVHQIIYYVRSRRLWASGRKRLSF